MEKFLFDTCCQLKKLLAPLENLRDLFQRGEYCFSTSAYQWLKGAEQTLRELGHHHELEMKFLLLRVRPSAILEQEVLINPMKRSQIRKRLAELMLNSLMEAEKMLTLKINLLETRLQDFQNRLRQLILMTNQDNAIPSPHHQDRTLWLEKVWEILVARPTTRAHAIYLTASLSANDRYYLMDELLPN